MAWMAFARWVPRKTRVSYPGAHRVEAASSRSNLLTTAFVNADGQLASVVMNRTDQAVAYNSCVGQDEAKVSIPAHAIRTPVVR